jgi:nucleoside 2-deoxyribosyltransferase
MFSFENVKATKHSLIQNGLSKMDLAKAFELGFLEQRPKPINITQNQKRNNKDQKRRKCLNLLKNMKNIRMNLQI